VSKRSLSFAIPPTCPLLFSLPHEKQRTHTRTKEARMRQCSALLEVRRTFASRPACCVLLSHSRALLTPPALFSGPHALSRHLLLIGLICDASSLFTLRSSTSFFLLVISPLPPPPPSSLPTRQPRKQIPEMIPHVLPPVKPFTFLCRELCLLFLFSLFARLLPCSRLLKSEAKALLLGGARRLAFAAALQPRRRCSSEPGSVLRAPVTMSIASWRARTLEALRCSWGWTSEAERKGEGG
jgi:hypothetical protein